jgi:hypothetical protein
MTSRILSSAAILEQYDPLHEARLLILIAKTSGSGPVNGIMKLAKMDFLLRYPKVLERALVAITSRKPSAARVAARISSEAKDTVEGRMIRFRYGPWDKRYRRWLAILVAKGLVRVYKEGRTVCVALTPVGSEKANEIAGMEAFRDLAERAEAVRLAVSDLPSTRLMKLVYEIAPELSGMRWGESIRI